MAKGGGDKQHQRQPKTVVAFLHAFQNLTCAERSCNQISDVLQHTQTEMDVINSLPEFIGNQVAMITYEKYVNMAVKLGVELFLIQEDLVKIFPNLRDTDLRRKVVSAYKPFTSGDKTQPGFWKTLGVSNNAVEAEKLTAVEEKARIDRIVEYLLAIGSDEYADQHRLVPYGELSPATKKVVDAEKAAAKVRQREQKESTIHKVDKAAESESSDGSSEGSSDVEVLTSICPKSANPLAKPTKEKKRKRDDFDDNLTIEEARGQRKQKRKAHSATDRSSVNLETSASMYFANLVKQDEANKPGAALWRLLVSKENIKEHRRKEVNKLLGELGVNSDTISVLTDFPGEAQELFSLLKPVPAAAAAKELSKLASGPAGLLGAAQGSSSSSTTAPGFVGSAPHGHVFAASTK